MRSTIHLVSRADYWPLALAIRPARRGPSWLRATDGLARAGRCWPRQRPCGAALGGGAAAAQGDREELLGKPVAHGIGLWLDLVRIPPLGTWERRRADLYALAEEWVGPPVADPRPAPRHAAT